MRTTLLLLCLTVGGIGPRLLGAEVLVSASPPRKADESDATSLRLVLALDAVAGQAREKPGPTNAQIFQPVINLALGIPRIDRRALIQACVICHWSVKE